METTEKRQLNPFMRFLNKNRQKFKTELLVQGPELKGRSLAMATAIYAGKLWQRMSLEERNQYSAKTVQLRFDNKYKVWIDDNVGCYYEDMLGVNYLGNVRMLEDVIF